MKKVLVIHNPISGAKSWKNVKKIIENELQQSGYDHVWIETQPVKHQPFENFLNESFHRIVVVGGDGTVANVARFLIQTANKTPLVIIPQGSGNLLAKTLSIPQASVRKAIRLGLQNSGKPVDAMRINRKLYALNAVGKGYDVFVMKNTPRALKRTWGLWAYVHTVLRTFFPYRKHPYKLTIDGKRHTVLAKTILVFNGFPIPGIHIGGAVRPDDGRLNIAVWNPRWFGKSTLTTLTGKTISIKSKKEREFDLDGEVFKGGTLNIEVLPRALNIVFTKIFS